MQWLNPCRNSYFFMPIALLAVVALLATGCPSEPGSGANHNDNDVNQNNDDNDKNNDNDDVNQDNDNGSDDSPTVEITSYPGDDGEPVLLDDGQTVDVEFSVEDCDSCSTECALEENTPAADDFIDCQSPSQEFSADAEGEFVFVVRLIDDDSAIDDDSVDLPIYLSSFEFGIEDLDAGATVEMAYPRQFTSYCGPDDCQLSCSWDDGDTDMPVSDCEAEDTFEVPASGEDRELTIEACRDDGNGPCLVQSYQFNRDDPQWYHVTTGESHTCAILDNDDSLWCWGDGDSGQLGLGDTDDHSTPQQVDGSWDAVSAGSDQTCGINTDGELFCWGNNDRDQLGIGSGENSTVTGPTAAQTSTTTWQQVSSGEDHSCAFDGPGELYCWGANNRGQLGDGSQNDQPSPTRVSTPWEASSAPIDIGDWDAEITDISAGDEHTCAITNDDTAYCWGNDDDGRVGTGGGFDDNLATTPQEVDDDFLSISAGQAHTCGIGTTSNGLVADCWGAGDSGQLGDGNETSFDTPTSVSGSLGYQSVSTGGEHSCSFNDDGDASCWGWQLRGRLGDGDESDDTEPSPVSVNDLDDVTHIATGADHSCAVDSGSLYCWGDGGDGRLGTGDENSTGDPTAIDWP